MVRKRTVLLAVAVVLCAAALFAIGVLLVGHFGRMEVRILGTTAVLVAMALLALPAVILAEHERAQALAWAGGAAAAVAAVLAVSAVWAPGDLLGKLTATAVTLTALGTQVCALVARSSEADPPIVHRLFLASTAAGALLATMIVTLTWAQFEPVGYGRLMASVAILDALLVALQPLLARAQPPMTPRPR